MIISGGIEITFQSRLCCRWKNPSASTSRRFSRHRWVLRARLSLLHRVCGMSCLIIFYICTLHFYILQTFYKKVLLFYLFFFCIPNSIFLKKHIGKLQYLKQYINQQNIIRLQTFVIHINILLSHTSCIKNYTNLCNVLESLLYISTEY